MNGEFEQGRVLWAIYTMETEPIRKEQKLPCTLNPPKPFHQHSLCRIPLLAVVTHRVMQLRGQTVFARSLECTPCVQADHLQLPR